MDGTLWVYYVRFIHLCHLLRVQFLNYLSTTYVGPKSLGWMGGLVKEILMTFKLNTLNGVKQMKKRDKTRADAKTCRTKCMI